jgi:hypothetical protein
MRKVNTNELEPLTWSSPKGTFAAQGIQVSEALGRKRDSTDLMERPQRRLMRAEHLDYFDGEE